MRGATQGQTSMITLRNPEDFVPKGHPIRAIKKLADAALKAMSPELDAMYSTKGRPSVPPEVLLKSSLLMALYSVRSERLFCRAETRMQRLFELFNPERLRDVPAGPRVRRFRGTNARLGCRHNQHGQVGICLARPYKNFIS